VGIDEELGLVAGGSAAGGLEEERDVGLDVEAGVQEGDGEEVVRDVEGKAVVDRERRHLDLLRLRVGGKALGELDGERHRPLFVRQVRHKILDRIFLGESEHPTRGRDELLASTSLCFGRETDKGQGDGGKTLCDLGRKGRGSLRGRHTDHSC
jgi:hypothetical protein